ncbi:MAG: penicillin-binding transpeptidase domain-containing protein [Deltaproteobacteria bacterium]|nr:penicillin-binding transpeptidase domain-containing protein [Deltaproteobacteria bacterium]
MALFGQGRALWVNVRILCLAAAMLGGAATVAHGAWDVGVRRGEELKALAKEQYIRRITVPARRGMIVDRHGEELAVEVEVDSVYADPKKVANPMAAAAALAPALGMDEALLRSSLTSKRHFTWVKRRVSTDEAGRVRALAIPGVEIAKESQRFYPGRSLAAHALGFSGLDSVGLEGVELKFDAELRGSDDAVRGLRDARGRVVFADGVFGLKGVVGNTIELSIDRTLQHIVERELEATIHAFEAKAGHVVMMDPYTGEILALANWPTYNPNTLSASGQPERRNRAVLDVFEPGSSFKVFTLAAALNSGAVRPDDMTFCENGRYEISGVKIHDDHPDGWLTPTQCLKRSSNICFAKLAAKLGAERLYHYLRRFGFGDPTHVDLPFEMRGVLHHFKKWYDVDLATVAFGQGVGVTDMQMAAALASLANGGMLMRPLLVRRIVGPEGEAVRSFAPEAKRRVVSRYTARLVADMMTAVTEEGGTGVEGALSGFLVAGKTGTAQKSEGSRGYHEDKWVASFVGFVPADKPRLVITVFIDEPVISHYGGSVAAPTLRRIADQSLRYLGVPPRGNAGASPKPVQVAAKRTAWDREERKEPAGREGDAGVTETEPGSNQVRAPELAGLTMKAAMDRLAQAGLRPLFLGTGIAAEQVPPAGDPVDVGGFVQVNFQPVLAQGGAPSP